MYNLVKAFTHKPVAKKLQKQIALKLLTWSRYTSQEHLIGLFVNKASDAHCVPRSVIHEWSRDGYQINNILPLRQFAIIGACMDERVQN